MGWIVLIAIAAAAAALLWITGFPRRLWTVPATALMLGAAGYAWQGSPGTIGAPVAAKEQKGEVDPNLVALREMLFGRFNLEFAYFIAADAMTRSGDPKAAVIWEAFKPESEPRRTATREELAATPPQARAAQQATDRRDSDFLQSQGGIY